ncbi:class 1 fructose-bisphosphatase [Pararhodospirillum photometricum]|uniref:Fructose-1,6-bisphosphatase class 1 n=1 Tax=Pararhodospirillum photometricum DSM 122 TaxID=1150469 RepID=H6SMZ8_PARPM|nr:class 1 fructose-bisphosphatase [Pararhodospirillum photometricum]CCG06874.1 Fructose-1,6-bisphosphatase class 1 [Pararhodospirillum photometricum DSM 122]
MLAIDRTTLAQFLVEEGLSGEAPALVGLILDVAQACKTIAKLIAMGQLAGIHGYNGDINVQGETQARLDLLSNEAFLRATERTGHASALASEEMEEIHRLTNGRARGPFLLVFDPLDGSSNIDTNGTVGSIFSIVPYSGQGREPETLDFLCSGRDQVVAGYALYGPATMFVLTVGKGVHGFTLDPLLGDFVLTHPHLRVAPVTAEFAINASNRRFWEPPIHAYVNELLAGATGPRGKDYNMRWIAALVADCHRILLRGGIYLYPRDTKTPVRPGRLRLLYEGAPIAMIMDQAGGRCITGTENVLDLTATELHQRVPLIFGSREEVDRVEALHQEHTLKAIETPLFQRRGLFRD